MMSCRDSEYKKFCAQIIGVVPFCQEVKLHKSQRMPSLWRIPDDGSLFFQLFDLNKIIIENNMIRFSSSGTSMYPCIKQGDTLYIEPKKAEQIKIGDIAAYSQSGVINAHRTIDKGKENGRDYIITRGDRRAPRVDTKIIDNDIMGIVSRIERKGRFLSTQEKRYNSIQNIFFEICIKSGIAKKYLFNNIVCFINYLQQVRIYKRIAKKLFSKLNKRIDFSMQVPLHDKINDIFYKVISSKEFISENLCFKGGIIPKFTVALNIDSKPVAFLSFIFRPKTCQFNGLWISGIKIPTVYRGLGLEEKLFCLIEDALKQLSISQILVSIPKNAYMEKKYFKNLGFEKASIYKDDHFLQNNNSPIVREIMQKKVNGEK